jgi:hypothetical protein
MATRKIDEKTLRVREIEASAKILALKIDAAARVISTGIKYGCLAYCAWLALQGVRALSGKITLANIALNFLGSISTNNAVCYTVTGGAVGWGYLERRLRKAKTETFQGRVRDLEKLIDPKRSSSNLTPQGDTNPMDEPT